MIETDARIRGISLLKERVEENRIPTLSETLHLAYFRGMCINIDLKEGIKNDANVARLVAKTGMHGRCVYATNGAGVEAINLIVSIDPQARFIDTKQNYAKEALKTVNDYSAKCYVYTGDFSDENIEEIRSGGCMLAAISLDEDNAKEAFRHHPDMAEYLHTSDFEKIEAELLKVN